MSVIAGKIVAVSGEFLAVSSDGTKRVLHEGDTVYEGERIVSHGGKFYRDTSTKWGDYNW